MRDPNVGSVGILGEWIFLLYRVWLFLERSSHFFGFYECFFCVMAISI